MDNYERGMIVGFFVGFGVASCFLIGFDTFKGESAIGNSQRDAVERGFGEWVVLEDGTHAFRWRNKSEFLEGEK